MGAWKIALRSLARRPGFTLTVAGLLVLGVGANTALLSGERTNFHQFAQNRRPKG